MTGSPASCSHTGLAAESVHARAFAHRSAERRGRLQLRQRPLIRRAVRLAACPRRAQQCDLARVPLRKHGAETYTAPSTA
jgi:hypothetical protein